MQILIKTLTGRKFTLETEDWNTVLNIKEKIQEHERLPPHQQRLVYEGKHLRDDEAVLLDLIRRIQTSKEELIQSPSSIVTLHLLLFLQGGGNVIAHRPDQIQRNSPSGSDDDGDSSDSHSDHQHQQNGFSHEIATADDLPAHVQEQVINSECTGDHASSPISSSKGSWGPRRFITNKLRKWKLWNTSRFVRKHKLNKLRKWKLWNTSRIVQKHE